MDVRSLLGPLCVLRRKVGTFGIASATTELRQPWAGFRSISSVPVPTRGTTSRRTISISMPAAGNIAQFLRLKCLLPRTAFLGTRPLVEIPWLRWDLNFHTQALSSVSRKGGPTGSLEIANSTHVNTSRHEGLGRVMYVVGALEYEKPFLGPLCRFLALHPRGSMRLQRPPGPP